MCFLDHAFGRIWSEKYEVFKSSEPDHYGLGRRLPGGSLELYADLIPYIANLRRFGG